MCVQFFPPILVTHVLSAVYHHSHILNDGKKQNCLSKSTSKCQISHSERGEPLHAQS